MAKPLADAADAPPVPAEDCGVLPHEWAAASLEDAPEGLPWGRLVAGRRSVRRYLPGAIEPQALRRILTAATSAPSAHNRQPWRFAVVTETPRKAALAEAMGQRLRRDRLADGDDPALVEADVARSAMRISASPALILVALTMAEMDRYPDARRMRAEHIMAVQGTAMAVQNLLLAARNEGLGACLMCAPLFCPETVVEVLGLPGDWQPQSLVTLGRPAGAGRERSRKALAEVMAGPGRSP